MRLIVWQSPQYLAILTEQTWSVTHIYKPPNIFARARLVSTRHVTEYSPAKTAEYPGLVYTKTVDSAEGAR